MFLDEVCDAQLQILEALKRFLGASRGHFRGLLEASFGSLVEFSGGFLPSENKLKHKVV